MAVPKFIKNSSGSLAEEAAINSSAGAGDVDKMVSLDANGVLDSTIVNSVTASAGAGDSDKVVALDAAGKIDNSMMPTGIGADTVVINTDASTTLSAGDFVNIYDNTGAECRLADSTSSGKEAHGFVLSAVSPSSPATIYFEGSNDQLSGLTAGILFLSTTAGQAVSTAPSGSGNVVQKLGVATSATAMNVEFSQPIILA